MAVVSEAFFLHRGAEFVLTPLSNAATVVFFSEGGGGREARVG